MNAKWEVWLRTERGDKVTTQVEWCGDIEEAIRKSLEKFIIKPEDVRELRVKFIAASDY